MVFRKRGGWRSWPATILVALAISAGCNSTRFATTRASARSPGSMDEPALLPDIAAQPQCGALSIADLRTCVDGERLRQDVLRLAHGERASAASIRSVCSTRLRALGYDVEERAYPGGINVIGSKPGFSKPSERVIVGAHYDRVQGCPGADDNASGVAASMELARVLSAARFDRTLVVACWDEGENAQRGSQHHAAAEVAGPGKVVAAIAIEALGYSDSQPDSQQIPERFEEAFPEQALALLERDYRGDFLLVVSDVPSEEFANAAVAHAGELQLATQQLVLTESLKSKQSDLHRSDHVSFWDLRLRALLLTDSGRFRNPHIHCAQGQDDAMSLDYVFMRRATQVGVATVAGMLELR